MPTMWAQMMAFGISFAQFHGVRHRREETKYPGQKGRGLQTADRLCSAAACSVQPTERQNHSHREDDGSDGVGQPVQEEGQSLHMVQNISIRPSGQRRSGEQHKDIGFQGLPGLASVAPALMSRSVTSSRC